MDKTASSEDELLDKFLSEVHRKKLKQSLGELISKLKRVEYNSSYFLAKEVISLLLQFVGSARTNSPTYLMRLVKAVGRRLIQARSVELVIGNAVRRVLFLIREEGAQSLKEEKNDFPANQGNSNGDGHQKHSTDASRRDVGLHAILSNLKETNLDRVENKDLRPVIIDGLNEMLEELENMYEPISKQALEHIHANEIVLVYGMSHSVQTFLEAAKRKRTFDVIVAEAGPSCDGHEMARILSTNNIRTTVITDSAIMAMMSRVNKVIIGAKAVLANGAILARSGINLVALAAKHHRVPVVCVTGLYKLSPLFAHDINSFNDLRSPGSVLDYGDIPSENIQIVAPAHDYVPPDLISLFITNNGGHQPSYVYRLLHEIYNPEDTVL